MAFNVFKTVVGAQAIDPVVPIDTIDPARPAASLAQA
jgi:hypothetical protein